MPRQLILALGLSAALLAVGPSGRAVAVQATATATSESAAPGHALEGRLASAAVADEGAAAGHGAAASHGGGEAQPNILEPQPSLAIWTVVVFLGLLLVLGRFAWKPLLGALHQREEHLEHVLHDTEKARNEAERLLAEQRRILAETQESVRSMLEEARREAQAAADEIARKAQADADAARQRAERDITTARDQALIEIWSKASELAVTVAGKVLSRELGPDEHRRLIEVATRELPAAPSGRNGQGGGRA
jgi:F-type H+-transporting ATPase subunit b